jgi:hypothetical protein
MSTHEERVEELRAAALRQKRVIEIEQTKLYEIDTELSRVLAEED